MIYLLFFKESIQIVLFSTFFIFLLPDCAKTPSNDSPLREDTCSIIIKDNVSNKVSNLLLGFNVVYPHETDKIWENGKIQCYLRDVKASLIRYPGGTVTSFYHWNILTGNGWADSFDPENNLSDRPGTEFMDVDEYMALIRQTGAEPLMGINVSSARRWGKVDEGIAEALALMKYCRENNFKVKYWFIDNEPYQPDSNGGKKTPEEYAALINLFVPAMKNYDSDIEIVANWNAGFANKRAEYEKLIMLAGSNIDIIDVHWYWGWKQSDQMNKWLAESPMQLWTKNSYINEIADFRKMAADFGFPGIKLASFEWNIGPSDAVENSPTYHQCALMQSEMLMQYMIGGLDMAVFWPLHWPDKNFAYRGLVNATDNSALPNLSIFKFMTQIQGNSLLETTPTVQLSDGLWLAGINETQDTLRICFLNKKSEDIRVEIGSYMLNGREVDDITSFILENGGNNSRLLSITPSGFTGNNFNFLAPPVSLTMMTVIKK
jgi:alpha-L-arabinofuranosidase